jgi:tRNA-2-methylthio-N6-dimethylallyladenosine synthase
MESPNATVHHEPRARRAYVETYGCQMNASDGELMQGILAARGYEMVDSPDEADVVLVNTCAIREHAEQRVLGRVAQLNRLKLERPDVVIGVTGCMAQRMGESLLERAPYVDIVVGPDSYRELPDMLGPPPGAPARPPESGRSKRIPLPLLPSGAASMGSEAARIVTGAAAMAGVRWGSAGLGFEPEENYEGLEVRRGSDITAWVPVQRGCDYRCTYCIVPYVRGPEKNRDPARILEEVRGIAGRGIPEVTLLGQTVNSYRHGDWDFARLLQAVARVDGIRRVRFTSPHPNDVTDALIAVMAREPAVCHQLHLPVQAGHDRTLKRMLRRYTVEAYRSIVKRVRAAIPDIALSTDVIVAFPGESDEEFQATLELLREIRFDDAFLYRYSAREGTPATRLPAAQFIDAAEAQARLETVIALQRAIQAEINASEVGRVVEVLVEREARTPGDMLGRTQQNKVVAFPGAPSLRRRFLSVRLTATTGATFRGRRLDPVPEDSAA